MIRLNKFNNFISGLVFTSIIYILFIVFIEIFNNDINTDKENKIETYEYVEVQVVTDSTKILYKYEEQKWTKHEDSILLKEASKNFTNLRKAFCRNQ